jgi:ATP-binding cassette, subfamily C, bacterial CydD
VRALDPRLLLWARGARTALAVDAALGVLTAALLLTQAALLATVIAGAFDHEDMASLARLLAWLVVVVAVRAGTSAGFESTGRRAAARIASQLRTELVGSRLRNASLDDDGADAAELAAAAVQGVDSLEPYFARYLPQLILAGIVPLLVLIWTSTVDLVSTLIMLVTLPLIPLFTALIGRATGARTRDRWQALARLSSHFLDVVRGLPTLRAFNRGAAQAERIAATSEDYRITTMQVLRLAFLSGAVLDLIATLATALVAVSLGIRLTQGGIGLRPALTVLLLTPELYAPLRALAAQFHASADGLAAAGRIIDLIGTPTAAPAVDRRDLPLWEVLRLEGVSVAYPDRGGLALDDFDLELHRGEVVALVGASGAGKSTVAALVLGLRTPDRGHVTVDGTDLTDIDLAAWRRDIGWLPQRPTLLRRSIRDNIGLGLLASAPAQVLQPAAIDRAVRGAAILAGADEFIADLRGGYGTVVGEGARSLSAGETRRTALARALAGHASLLVLDEPTANLDTTSAALVTAGIRKAAQDTGCAVLLIEHRVEAAAAADRIVRLADRRADPSLIAPAAPASRNGSPA